MALEMNAGGSEKENTMPLLPIALAVLAQSATPPSAEARPGPGWGREWGRLSLLADTTVGTGVGLEVLAVPYLDVQAELSTDVFVPGASARTPFAVRAGPSGNIFELRNARGEGLSMRGALLGGVFNAKGVPYFTLNCRLEGTFWATRHLGVSVGLNGGFNTMPFLDASFSPELGFSLGLAL